MEIQTINLPSISEQQTREIGIYFGKRAQCGDVFALIGELGAGKTVFAQGIATGFGIPTHYPITSPTFTLVNEYESPRGLLFHMDIYRLAEVSDLTDIGSDELIASPNGIAVVEWADRALAAMPEITIFVRFFHISEFSRLLEVSAPAAIMERMGIMELAKQGACED